MKRLTKTLVTGVLVAASVTIPQDSPAQAAWRGTCSTPEMVTLAYYAGWPPKQIPRVMHVMYGESRCKWWARNRVATGLMQIHRIHVGWLGLESRDDLYDPFTNLLAARKIWERQGWKAWTGQK